MKSLEEIIKQKAIYLNDWKENEKNGVVSDFEQNLDDINILFASYGYANYSGDAFVLYEKDGSLFEVHGGHCSCYGLEGQFTPEETTLESLEFRLISGSFGYDDYAGNEFGSELKTFLGIE